MTLDPRRHLLLCGDAVNPRGFEKNLVGLHPVLLTRA
jgi:hypothetical protein